MGGAAPRPLDLARVQSAWEASPSLREDFARLGFRAPSAFLADFLLAEPDAARLTLGADLNTDDLLPLEFSAPKSLHRDTAAANYRMIRGFRTRELPLLAGAGAAQLDTAGARHDLGIAYLRKDLQSEAAAQFERALAQEPRHVPSLLALGRVQLRLDLPLRAIETLQAAARQDPRNAEAHALLARVWAAQQLPAKALEAAAWPPPTPGWGAGRTRSPRWRRRSPSSPPTAGCCTIWAARTWPPINRCRPCKC